MSYSELGLSAVVGLSRMWSISGEGVDVGEGASEWVSQFLGLGGCRLYYMAPRNKARKLAQDDRWTAIATPEDEVHIIWYYTVFS